MDYQSLYIKTVEQLKLIAKQEGVKIPPRSNKQAIIDVLLKADEEKKASVAKPQPAAAAPAPEEDKQTEENAAPKRKRGRPRKNPLPVKEKTPKAVPQPEPAAPSVEAPEQPEPVSETFSEPEAAKEAVEAEVLPEVSEETVEAKTLPEPAIAPAEQRTKPANEMQTGEGHGVLELHPDGYGFLRSENCLPGPKDVYVSNAQIRRFNLRNGDYLVGITRPQREGDRFEAMIYINTVNGLSADAMRRRPYFDSLTPVFPNSRLRLETPGSSGDLALRAIDLVAPIGKGQRGLIVSPPKAGKTVLLKKIANSITENYPEVKLIVLLIDERPEEVTDMQRSTSAEVMYSTFDEEPENHARLAETVLEYAQRQVEVGKDVVILLDSITRLARAYNLIIPPTGRSLSGGLDPGALYKPKKFFGAARNIENGGSLTIIATALVDTGSRMDDIIYEEFKGTGNMELHLDRKLSERRIFPAIDLNRSGTRRDDLLYTKEEAEGALVVRRSLSTAATQDASEQLIGLMEKTANNAEFVQRLKGWMNALKK